GVVSRIKGPRGTPVKIQIVRAGVPEPLELTAIRDEIAKFTINYAFMIRPRVGYIKLDSFAETSGAELRDALRKLDTHNMDGLVQSVYQVGRNAGLALTTQKWYTPSGRLIQRDYSQISQFDYYNHGGTSPAKKDDIKHSDTGRIVYGGGGITPDYLVEEAKPNEFQTTIVSRFAFFT